MGLGLGEDTGAIIKDGRDVEIVGSGLVILIDGTQIKYTNLTEVRDGDPISVDNVILHVLSSGKKFDLKERKFINNTKS